MNEHELKLHCVLSCTRALLLTERVIVLCVYAAHSCSFNSWSDYSSEMLMMVITTRFVKRSIYLFHLNVFNLKQMSLSIRDIFNQQHRLLSIHLHKHNSSQKKCLIVFYQGIKLNPLSLPCSQLGPEYPAWHPHVYLKRRKIQKRIKIR